MFGEILTTIDHGILDPLSGPDGRGCGDWLLWSDLFLRISNAAENRAHGLRSRGSSALAANRPQLAISGRWDYGLSNSKSPRSGPLPVVSDAYRYDHFLHCLVMTSKTRLFSPEITAAFDNSNFPIGSGRLDAKYRSSLATGVWGPLSLSEDYGATTVAEACKVYDKHQILFTNSARLFLASLGCLRWAESVTGVGAAVYVLLQLVQIKSTRDKSPALQEWIVRFNQALHSTYKADPTFCVKWLVSRSGGESFDIELEATFGEFISAMAYETCLDFQEIKWQMQVPSPLPSIKTTVIILLVTRMLVDAAGPRDALYNIFMSSMDGRGRSVITYLLEQLFQLLYKPTLPLYVFVTTIEYAELEEASRMRLNNAIFMSKDQVKPADRVDFSVELFQTAGAHRSLIRDRFARSLLITFGSFLETRNLFALVKPNYNWLRELITCPGKCDIIGAIFGDEGMSRQSMESGLAQLNSAKVRKSVDRYTPAVVECARAIAGLEVISLMSSFFLCSSYRYRERAIESWNKRKVHLCSYCITQKVSDAIAALLSVKNVRTLITAEVLRMCLVTLFRALPDPGKLKNVRPQCVSQESVLSTLKLWALVTDELAHPNALFAKKSTDSRAVSFNRATLAVQDEAGTSDFIELLRASDISHCAAWVMSFCNAEVIESWRFHASRTCGRTRRRDSTQLDNVNGMSGNRASGKDKRRTRFRGKATQNSIVADDNTTCDVASM